MMKTIIVEINNNKAYKILKNLEELQLIKIKKQKISSPPKHKSFAGTLPNVVAEELQDYVSKSRSEWHERNIK